MKKSLFLLFISLIFTSLSYPQLTIRHQIASPKAADSLDISMGVRALELEDEIFDKGVGIATELDVEYGARLDLSISVNCLK